MKKSVLILALSIFSIVLNLNAQTSGMGIYLSANDFTQGKLSYVNNQGKTYKINLHTTFNGATIKISDGNSVIKLQKDAVFGYMDSHNTCYRFIKNVAYKIVNPGEQILLYSKVTTVGGHKSSHQIIEYFFSANASAPLYSLTKWNLKTILHDEVAFHKLLDVYFHSDDELIAYDTTSKMYQLNHVYDLSRQ